MLYLSSQLISKLLNLCISMLFMVWIYSFGMLEMMKSMVKEEQETSLKLASIYYSYGLDCWCKWLRFVVHISNKTYCNLNACCYWKPCTQFQTLYVTILQHCFQLRCSCAQAKEMMGLTWYIIPSECKHYRASLSLACEIVWYSYILHFDRACSMTKTCKVVEVLRWWFNSCSNFAYFFDVIVKLRLVVWVLMGLCTSFLILAKDGMLLFSCETIMYGMEGVPH